MQASNAPSKSPVAFATSGTKNTIPVASQIGITPGLASFTDGFPPLTMTPLVAGGIPPQGADFNGILNFLSSGQRWANAGGGYTFDATFAAAIGGYPRGCLLLRADLAGYWMSTADNNTANPDTGGAGWLAAFPSGDNAPGADTGTANVYQVAYNPAVSALTDGLLLRFRAKTSNTAASTFSPNGLTAKTIVGQGNAALQGGEIVANGICSVVYSLAGDRWILLSATGGGPLQVGNATQSQHAITRGQLAGLLPSASTTVAGISRFSTAAEAQSWSEAATVLTPSSLAQSFWGANQSLAPNGYQRLPGGLIIQWALGPGANPAQDSTISYPIAFPTRTLQAVASMTTDCDCIAQVTSFTQNTVTVRLDQIGSSGTGSAPRVIAIGH